MYEDVCGPMLTGLSVRELSPKDMLETESGCSWGGELDVWGQ